MALNGPQFAYRTQEYNWVPRGWYTDFTFFGPDQITAHDRALKFIHRNPELYVVWCGEYYSQDHHVYRLSIKWFDADSITAGARHWD